jgi:hypothetical protein
MLVQVLDAEPGFGQRADDLAHAVLPGVLERRLDRGVRVGVGPGVRELQRLLRRPVVVVEAQLGRVVAVVEDPGERVGLGDVEEAARPHEVGDHLGPAGHVGQPVEHSEGGEHHVEVALQPVREVDHVGDDEAGLQAGLGGQEPRLLDGPFREVGAGDPGSPPDPGECVQPEVALQVEQVLAGDVADLLDQQREQVVAAPGLPAVDVVERRADVDGRPLVPEGAVGGDMRVHAGSLARRRLRCTRFAAAGRTAAGRTASSPRAGPRVARRWRPGEVGPGVGSPNPRSATLAG